jgi:hypothetical protein
MTPQRSIRWCSGGVSRREDQGLRHLEAVAQIGLTSRVARSRRARGRSPKREVEDTALSLRLPPVKRSEASRKDAPRPLRLWRGRQA